MATIEQSIEIATTPVEIFLFFVPQRMPYWYGAEMAAEFEVSGGAADFAVSQKVHISGKLGKKEVAHTAVITRYEWNRVLEWRFEDDLRRARPRALGTDADIHRHSPHHDVTMTANTKCPARLGARPIG